MNPVNNNSNNMSIDLNDNLIQSLSNNPGDLGVLSQLDAMLNNMDKPFPITQAGSLVKLSNTIDRIISNPSNQDSSTLRKIKLVVDRIGVSFNPKSSEISQFIDDCGVDFYVNMLWRQYNNKKSDLTDQLKCLIEANKKQNLNNHQFRSVISSLLSLKDADNNTITHSKEIVDLLFDHCFDKIEMQDLVKMLFSLNSKLEMPITLISKTTERLVKLGRLCQIFFRDKKYDDANITKFLDKNPELKDYVKIEIEQKDLCKIFSEIPASNKYSDQYEKIAHYVYLYRMPVLDLIFPLGSVSMGSSPISGMVCDKDEAKYFMTSNLKFLILAEFLRYFDFRVIPTVNNSSKGFALTPYQMLLQAKRPFSAEIWNINVFQNHQGTMKELPYCCQLSVQCSQIVELPEFPNAHTIYIGNNPFLELSNTTVSGCKKFTSILNPNIREIPPMPFCKEFTCLGCDNLKKIPSFPLCEIFLLSSNKSLPQDLSSIKLPRCKRFECSRCKNVKTLPDLPAQEYVSIIGSDEIEEFKSYPSLQKIDVTESSKLQNKFNADQSLLKNCEVITGTRDISRPELYVNVSDIGGNPVSILNAIADVWQDSKFPQIFYRYEIFESQIIDDGGVGRDLVSKIFKVCFVEGELEGFLKITKEGLPELTKENQAKAFKVIGKIMAHSVNRDDLMKTGPMFADNFYNYMITYNQGDDKWSLSTYLKILGAPKYVVDAIIEKKQVIVFERIKDKPFVQALVQQVEDNGDGLSLIEKVYDKSIKLSSADALFQGLVAIAKEHPTIKATKCIAEGFKSNVPPAVLKELGELGHPVRIKLRIEGSITKDMFYKFLRWETAGDVTDEELDRIKNFMHIWTESGDASLSHLYDFLNLASGTCGQGVRSVKMIVEQDPNRAQQPRLPYSSTCEATLRLRPYLTYEEFARDLDFCIRYMDAGTGFADQDEG